MATNEHDGSGHTQDIDVTFPFQGHDGPEIPNRADVTTTEATHTADANDTLVATIFAGEQGRWSIDFGVDDGRVEITRAYQGGMRVDVDSLPTWMAPVRRAIEEHLQND